MAIAPGFWRLDRSEPEFEWAVAFIVITGLVILHAICLNQHGFFRDELYYLACARHLDWGYVDQPPLSIAILKGIVYLFGDSTSAIRIPILVCDGLIVLIWVAIAQKFGGGKFAQTLTALTFAAAPVYMVVGHLFAMNAFDLLLWSGAIYVWSFAIRTDDVKPWLGLGLIVGLALLNKWSVLWLCSGIFVAMLCGPERLRFLRAGPYLALAVAILVSFPHWKWEQDHAWATLEFLKNATQRKMLRISPPLFVATQIVVMNPMSLPIWAAGIYAAIVNPRWRPYGISFLVILAILLISGRARPNYLSPGFPLVIVPGGIYWESRLKGLGRSVFISLLALSGIGLSFLSLPLVHPENLYAFLSGIPFSPPQDEKGPKSPLQGLSDMLGWPELASGVRTVFDSLSPAEQAKCRILANNYGEAGAIEHFAVDLPPVICTHNNYWLWGPRGWDGEVAIAINFPPEMTSEFRSVVKAGRAPDSLAVPEERRAQISIVRGLKGSVQDFWIRHKKFE